MKIFLLLLIVTCSFGQSSQKIKLVITIDDLPFVSQAPLSTTYKDYIYDRILEGLKKENIQALGFVTGNSLRIYDHPYIKRFISEGHLIGNHTYSHLYYNMVDFKTYKNDILKCFDVLQTFNAKKKYFRFPYLVEGNTKEKFDSVYSFLKVNSITPVPVSLPCFDYEYIKDFESAFRNKDSVKMKVIVKEYLQTIKSIYLDRIELGRRKTKCNPSHITFFHMNLLNAYCITELLNLFKELNFVFSNVDVVLSEKEYMDPPVFTGHAGLTHFEKYIYKR